MNHVCLFSFIFSCFSSVDCESVEEAETAVVVDEEEEGSGGGAVEGGGVVEAEEDGETGLDLDLDLDLGLDLALLLAGGADMLGADLDVELVTGICVLFRETSGGGGGGWNIHSRSLEESGSRARSEASYRKKSALMATNCFVVSLNRQANAISCGGLTLN